MYEIDFRSPKIREWLRQNAYMVLAVIWVVLTLFVMALWDYPAPLLVMMVLYLIVAGALVASRLVSDAQETKRAISSLESREVINEGDVRLLIATIKNMQEDIMAIGNQTKAALEELREAIATETDQAAEKIIAHVNADEATAQAIRDAVADVKNIIPDDVEDTDVPAVQEPEDPEVPGDDEVEVDPEALPGDDA